MMLVKQGVSGNVTTYLDTAVTNGTTYTYVITAINSGGQTNSNSVNATASCVTPPGPFTLTVTPWCSGSAPVNLLEWTGSAGVTLPYEVYRNSALLFTTTSNQYTDAAVTAGTSYSYVIVAKNSAGQTSSNTVSATAKTDCAAPVAPVISALSQSSATIGDGSFMLTITGANFDSTVTVLWGFSGQTPSNILPTTFVNTSTLAIAFTQTTGGYSPFSPGILLLQVLKPGPSFWDGPRSNTVQFSLFNPVPVVSSVSGTCQAGLNCVPGNGFDARVLGTGFVNNVANIAGSSVASSTLTVNGATGNWSPLGQGPVYAQMQLYLNGALILTPGTYTLQICNVGTSQGTACSTGSLTVTP